MKRLRLYFALFFILLAVPMVILLRHTYSNLEQESFFLYRRTAEGLMATVHQRLQENLLVEEQRPYTHYRYIHVADRPVPQQEGLNLSPLASFPVQSEIPGILGYFQIDPDGTFHSPLLPDGVSDSGMVVPQREEREQMRDQLVTLLEGRTFSPSTGLRAQLDDLILEEAPASVGESLSEFRENLESNVDVTLESEYARQASREPGLGVSSEVEEKKESVQRRVQKTSPMQAEVFDSKLKDAYSDELDEAKGNASAQSADNLSSLVAGEPEPRPLRRRDEQLAPRDADVQPEAEVVAEVDPFQSELIDRNWLVLYRSVWAQERRYIQGFATSLTEFLQAHLDPALLNSALPETASYLVFYEGEILQPEAGDSSNPKPLLLHSSALPYPLSDFQLAITVGNLPQSPAHQLVNVLAVFLSLLFFGGLLGIYRLTTSQMELSQKKSDFVSAVSHELKTPLTAIRMYGEILMEGWVEEEKKERYYQHIHDESERLSRLIQNVLTLAELERNEWQINLEARHPVELITSITERLNNQVQRAGFEFSTVTEGEVQSIQVDTDALTQILINLIDNAIKFSKEAESKKIVLTVSQVGTDCYIRVRDFGPGIPSRKLKSIFEKFYRIDNEMTRTTRGTGIGLALVKMLADAMGAHVDVTNRKPGTEFSLRFPTETG